MDAGSTWAPSGPFRRVTLGEWRDEHDAVDANRVFGALQPTGMPCERSLPSTIPPRAADAQCLFLFRASAIFSKESVGSFSRGSAHDKRCPRPGAGRARTPRGLPRTGVLAPEPQRDRVVR